MKKTTIFITAMLIAVAAFTGCNSSAAVIEVGD